MTSKLTLLRATYIWNSWSIFPLEIMQYWIRCLPTTPRFLLNPNVSLQLDAVTTVVLSSIQWLNFPPWSLLPPWDAPTETLNPSGTAEAINNHFAKICNQLPALALESLPTYLPAEEPPPVIYQGQVLKALQKLKSAKSGHPLDLPIRLIKEFAPEIALPLTCIFNLCLKEGNFPESWKTATIIPVPKIKHVLSFDQLRPISLTPILARIF